MFWKPVKNLLGMLLMLLYSVWLNQNRVNQNIVQIDDDKEAQKLLEDIIVYM